jgi:hypothetical protein
MRMVPSPETIDATRPEAGTTFLRLEDVTGARIVLDPATGAVHQIGTNAFNGWRSVGDMQLRQVPDGPYAHRAAVIEEPRTELRNRTNFDVNGHHPTACRPPVRGGYADDHPDLGADGAEAAAICARRC